MAHYDAGLATIYVIRQLSFDDFSSRESLTLRLVQLTQVHVLAHGAFYPARFSGRVFAEAAALLNEFAGGERDV